MITSTIQSKIVTSDGYFSCLQLKGYIHQQKSCTSLAIKRNYPEIFDLSLLVAARESEREKTKRERGNATETEREEKGEW